MTDDLLPHFLVEARELIAQVSGDLAALARVADDRATIDSAFRAIHTLKGSVAIFDMAAAGRALHAAEDLLERARAGTHPLTESNLGALVATVDQTDRWVDAMERDGMLPASADGEADTLLARLATGATALPVSETAAPAPWADRLAAAHGESGEALIAFRYTPDRDCFFRGDDPLAIVAKIPELRALSIQPLEAWPALDAFEPFECAVVIEGVSAAPLDALRTALRFVIDQVEIVPLAIRESARDSEVAVAQTNSLRVDTVRIDALANGVGELIVANNALAHLADDIARNDPKTAAQIRDAHAALGRAVGAMQRAVMDVRMVAIGPTLRRLPRNVREIADALGKPVTLEIHGEKIEVDKGIADAVFEPLLHIVRNALDHGIEPGEVRRSLGKPETGRITLTVCRDGDAVLIDVSDDGAGIDPARIRDVAVERGVLAREAADALDDAQALRLIFAPGFSTAAAITAVSGRGVGMDAVQTAADRLGGRVEIASTLGQGCSIRLRLPLSAILTRLLVIRVGAERYGVPLDRILETASVARDRIVPLGLGRACVLRDRTVAVVSLAQMLGSEERLSPFTKLLVTETGSEPVGMIVDGFGDRIDGLVRPKAGLMANIPGVSGTTTLGDGTVLLVLDLPALVA